MDNEELFDFFSQKYDSIKSVSIIYNQKTDESRGFGFLSLLSYEEFLDILRSNFPFILRNRKLIIR